MFFNLYLIMVPKNKYVSSFYPSLSNDFDYIILLVKSLHAKSTAWSCDFIISHGGRKDVVKHVETQNHMDSIQHIKKRTEIKDKI